MFGEFLNRKRIRQICCNEDFVEAVQLLFLKAEKKELRHLIWRNGKFIKENQSGKKMCNIETSCVTESGRGSFNCKSVVTEDVVSRLWLYINPSGKRKMTRKIDGDIGVELEKCAKETGLEAGELSYHRVVQMLLFFVKLFYIMKAVLEFGVKLFIIVRVGLIIVVRLLGHLGMHDLWIETFGWCGSRINSVEGRKQFLVHDVLSRRKLKRSNEGIFVFGAKKFYYSKFGIFSWKYMKENQLEPEIVRISPAIEPCGDHIKSSGYIIEQPLVITGQRSPSSSEDG
jgi:hypothetical protein